MASLRDSFLGETLAARMKAVGLRREHVSESFSRSGGKGGQNVNKVSTCVVLKHLPTGIIVRCSSERSQSRNRRQAWENLTRKLEDREKAFMAARRAAVEKKRRRARRRPRALKQKILRTKKHRAELKKNRSRPRWD